jgi:hypothetical protein
MSWRRSGDEVIILDLASSEYLSLNASAGLLWEHLAACTSANERTLTQVLVDAYELDPGRARGDVAAFVAVMDDRDLLERS